MPERLSPEMSGGEILTLQFGNYSNYVGAHFWNFQDELLGRKQLESHALDELHDKACSEEFQSHKLYRNLTSNRRVESTPRVLIFDVKGKLGSLNPDSMNPAIHDAHDVGAESWTGEVSVLRSEPVRRNRFFDYLEENSFFDVADVSDKGLRDVGGKVEDEDEGKDKDEDEDEDEYIIDSVDVTSWTDFLKAKFHHRSLIELPLFSDVDLFDNFSMGASDEIISRVQRDDYLDSFRYFLEECDSLSCVNVLVDVHDGFSGFSQSILEDIREEIPRVLMPVWAFTDPDGCKSGGRSLSPDGPYYGSLSLKSCNIPLFYSSMSEIATVVIPLDMSSLSSVAPYTIQSNGTFYHSSALAAAAIDTSLSCCYLKNASSATGTDLNSTIRKFSGNGHFQLVQSELSFPIDHSQGFSDTTVPKERGILTPFTTSISSASSGPWAEAVGGVSWDSIVYTSTCFSRGLNREKLFSMTKSSSSTGHNCLTDMKNMVTPLSIPVSYPDFFYEKPEGIISSTFANLQRMEGKSRQSSVYRKISRPIDCCSLTSLGCSSVMTSHIQKVRRHWIQCTRSCDVRSAQWQKVGMTAEDRAEVSEILHGLNSSTR